MNNQGAMKKTVVGAALASACAYAITFGAMVGFGEADAGFRKVPSSDCHSALDNNGSTVNNSGALTYTGSGTKSIFCPMIDDSSLAMSSSIALDVYGSEGTNGSLSRTCGCNLNPISCACSTATNWANNTSGIDGLVADNVNPGAWAGGPAEKFGYILHTLTTNSSLAGVRMTSP